MSNQYMYSGDQAIIIPEGAIIWNDQSHDQSSLAYFDANDTNDSTNNESYVTAIDSNETQYLSILEHSDSNEMTLEDLHNLTIENRDVSDVILPDDISHTSAETVQENNDENDGEVIVFTMDGSDDLYGLQLTNDESGNVRKYQFKFRATPDGQLEPIPETVTLLPNDIQPVEENIDNLEIENVETDDTDQAENQQYILVQTPLESNDDHEESGQNNIQMDALNIEHVYIKGECHSPDNLEEDTAETDNVDAEILRHCIDSVAQGENLETHLENLRIKTESYEDGDITICQDENAEGIEELEQAEEHQNEQFLAEVEHEENHDQLVQHFLNDNNNIEVQYETELETQERSAVECLYKCGEYANEYLEQTAGNVGIDSETEEYRIAGEAVEIEDAVVTAASDVEENYPEPIVHKSGVLKTPLGNVENEDKATKPVFNVKCYVVYQEKENFSLAGNKTVHSQLPLPKLMKSNPRSVLRASFLSHKDKRQKLTTNILPECDLYHKRFAKNKEAMQAKHFHNFLNRTTIPHAPIRQQRQPRKQEIKPVIERSDEEIIVQEVIVSSGGFIESLSRKVGNRKVTAVVELSDSEEDLNPQAKKNLRKTHHLLRNPSESELSIIEINSDYEESEVRNNDGTSHSPVNNNSKRDSARSSSGTLKRRRGRPPSKKVRFESSDLEDIGSSQSKRNRVDQVPQCNSNTVPIASATNLDRQELICPFCPKTFPSQNSLNTHIIHHNLENSLKNKAKMNSRSSLMSRKSLLPKVEYNHKCDDCQETFKNSILLKKHVCTKKQTSSFNCSVCLKQFRDITLLNIHKKSHAKLNLVKNTTVVQITPNKMLRKSTTSLMKPKRAKSPNKSFKCPECPKICDSEGKLNIHIKLHKKFMCPSCFSAFSSKVLLDTHVTTKCVKLKPGNKRLSFTIKKSFIHTPPRRLSISKPKETLLNRSILSFKLECDKCNQKFSTFRNMYIHKVQKHGLTTPDKSLMTKPKQGLYKPIAVHGGIPANERLQKAYAAMRQKLAETDNFVVT